MARQAAIRQNDVEVEFALQCAVWSEIAGQWESEKTSEEEIEEIYSSRSPGREIDL